MKNLNAFDYRLILAIGFLSLLFPLQIYGQSNPADALIVQSVQIEFDGFRSVSDSFVRNNIQIRKGMRFDRVLLDQSIRTLNKTGKFEFVDVDILDPQPEGVVVQFKLISKYTIERIEFKGNDSFSDKRLLDKTEVEVLDSLDEYALNLAADEIVEYYIKKGYPDAKASYSIQGAQSGKGSNWFCDRRGTEGYN